MSILGISAGFHDAAATVISSQGDVLFAGHAERYSKIKHDPNLNSALIADAISHGHPDQIAYYERPWAKKTRQLYAGQYSELFEGWSVRNMLYKVAPQLETRFPGGTPIGENLIPINTYNHHKCHAAAGFQTSPFDHATVVIVDAIGEWDTISIWDARYTSTGQAEYVRLWRQIYPHSLGLFYSAMTQRAGLHPLNEEYILMGMAAYANAQSDMYDDFVEDPVALTFKENLHVGCDDYSPASTDFEIAASAQFTLEKCLHQIMFRACNLGKSENLVYMGGVALNCLANRQLGCYFEDVWIMPCPGDAGSSLGAAALAYGKRLNWQGPNLGTNIPGKYPVTGLLDELLTNKIVGVASGRTEFGPRALGNRSLLADPRGFEIKDQVNEIKQRQQFRPFAPVILEEYVHHYFDMPNGFNTSPYMQTVAGCKYPDNFPAITHHDYTSRVQTVSKNCVWGVGIRKLLEDWFVMTGCPMLLNTSLNIRGEPMVNDRADADRFEQLYGIKVIS